MHCSHFCVDGVCISVVPLHCCVAGHFALFSSSVQHAEKNLCGQSMGNHTLVSRYPCSIHADLSMDVFGSIGGDSRLGRMQDGLYAPVGLLCLQQLWD